MQDRYIEHSDGAQLVKDPLVSVVMITYNHEHYLPNAIEGVLQQKTDFQVELIIGEDCSPDRTRDLALAYQARFPRSIRVLASERNVGMHKNHQRVISAARGKYIAFCEGDDFWHRADKLQMQVQYLEEDPAIILVCSDYRLVGEDGSTIRDNCNPTVLASREWFVYDELVTDKVSIATATACARREATVRTLLSSPACRDWSLPFGDLQLWLELSRQGRIRYLKESLASYRQTRGSASRSRDYRRRQAFLVSGLEVRDRFLAQSPLASGPKATKAQRISYTRAQLRAAAAAGDARSAVRVMRRLRELGVDPRLRERALVLVARLPLGRYCSGPMATALLRGSRALSRSCVRPLTVWDPDAVAGVLTQKYPMPAQTRTDEELLAWQDSGIKLIVFSLRSPTELERALVDGRRRIQDVLYLDRLGLADRLLGLGLVLRNPVKFLTLLFLLSTRSRFQLTSPQHRLLSVASLFRAAFLVPMLRRWRIAHLHAPSTGEPATVAWLLNMLSGTPVSFRGGETKC
jgi:Glycosyl transferase family 2